MELIAAVLGPVIAGTVSIMIYVGKRNADHMDRSVDRIMLTMGTLEDKVEDCRVEVAKNSLNQEILEDLKHDLKGHIDDSRKMHDQVTLEMREVKDMYWNLRMEVLQIKDNS